MPAMNCKLETARFDRPLLPVVVAIIVIGLGALVREWRNAHTGAAHPESVIPPPAAQQLHPPATEPSPLLSHHADGE